MTRRCNSHTALGALGALALLAVSLVPAFAAPDAVVTVGSPPTPFSQNKQNEPAVAVDPAHPNVVAAGANEQVDEEACSAGDPTSCPFTAGVGSSGAYFSFDAGASWTQPTYTGWTARDCLGPDPCSPHVGPIGTLPWYYEAGLVSDGDPSLAFGPRPGPGGTFSWANGSRLYYANLASNFGAVRSDQTFKGYEAIAVSRSDDLASAAAGNRNAWMRPVIVSSRRSATTFSDKEQVWADNAATSRYFGRAYTCWTSFRSTGLEGPAPILVSRSSDGGSTWSAPQQLSPAPNNSNSARQGCALRTDSRGVVYVFWEASKSGRSVQFMSRSLDGGASFEKSRAVADVGDVGLLDPASGDVTFDGVAGGRTDSFPSVDIANGAPTGAGATDEIVLAWSNGPTPTNTHPGPNEKAFVEYSTNQGLTWSAPVNAAPASDRPDFPAIAISPNGTDLYVTYDNLLQPWQSSALAPPRLMQGVVRHADVGTGGAPGPWTDLDRAAVGDARGASANALFGSFIGDYNYVAATNGFALALWNDVRFAADCPAVDAYRQSLASGNPTATPAPSTDCPATFGNSDIFAGTHPDPTP
jgi:hypothetical protein